MTPEEFAAWEAQRAKERAEMDARVGRLKSAEEEVKIASWGWTKTLNGGFLSANFVITNGGPVAVTELKLVFTTYAPNGVKLDRHVQTIHETIEPGGSIEKKNWDCGFIDAQTHSVGLKLLHFQTVEK